MGRAVIRLVVHRLTNIRTFQYKQLAKFARGREHQKILELGSGKLERGKQYYSGKHLFSDSNDFIQSDIREEFGHPIVDVTTMDYIDEFDVILCLNVLEHVFDYETAIKNIWRALRKRGTAVISVPAMYPLHDEPHDYWRFTEHSLKRLLDDFTVVAFLHNGKREFPFAYYVEVTK